MVPLHSARVLSLVAKMVKGLPVEDRLDGVSNYGSWKPRVLMTLEENEVKDFALIAVPVPNDAVQQASWRKSDVKARKILMVSMTNHLLSVTAKKETTKEMFDALKKLFERDSTSGSIALRTQLHTIKMTILEFVASYFTRVIELRDQLGDIGETIYDRELSIYILRGLPNSWESFVQSVSGHSKVPKFDKLWAVCTEEEARLATKHGSSHDENQALSARSRPWKGKKKFGKKDFRRRDRGDRSDSRPSSSRDDGRKDYLKVQCYGCRELGHIKSRCPNIKGKQKATVAEIDEPSTKRLRRSHFSDSEFLLLSALSGTLHSNRDSWLIDNGASCHRTGYGDHLLNVV